MGHSRAAVRRPHTVLGLSCGQGNAAASPMAAAPGRKNEPQSLRDSAQASCGGNRGRNVITSGKVSIWFDKGNRRERQLLGVPAAK